MLVFFVNILHTSLFCF